MSSALPFFQMPPTTDGAKALGDLSTGSVGAEVRDLQEILAALGFYKGELDGQYGPKTEAAVSAFQSNAGIAPTGVADAATIAAIRAQVPQGGATLTSALLSPGGSAQPGAPASSTSPSLWQRISAMPLWEKALLAVGAFAVGGFIFGVVKRQLGGLGEMDPLADLSMQRRRCRAILPTADDAAGAQTIDALDVRED